MTDGIHDEASAVGTLPAPGLQVNLGCGRDIRPGWINVDSVPLPGVDHVADLDNAPRLPFPDDSVELIEGSHVIEHLRHPLPLMQELWRVARPGATCVFRCPYGSSDDADEDPTHVRRMFLNSWGFFSQPFYWRASYQYEGDWRTVQVQLLIEPEYNHLPDERVMAAIHTQRNVVREMTAVLEAVKPARPPKRELQEPLQVVIHRL